MGSKLMGIHVLQEKEMIGLCKSKEKSKVTIKLDQKLGLKYTQKKIRLSKGDIRFVCKSKFFCFGNNALKQSNDVVKATKL